MSNLLKSFTNSVKHWYLPLILGIIFIICGIYTFSTNAKSGKITCFRFSERGGHRLKAALKRVVWFARERPLRGGRLFRRYREVQVRV